MSMPDIITYYRCYFRASSPKEPYLRESQLDLTGVVCHVGKVESRDTSSCCWQRTMQLYLIAFLLVKTNWTDRSSIRGIA